MSQVAERRFVLLGAVEADADVVHRPPPGNDKPQPLADHPFGQQEVARRQALVGAWTAVPLVEPQQFVEHRGPPSANDRR